LQCQEIEYQKENGDVLAKLRYDAESTKYRADAEENTTRRARAQAELPKIQTKRSYNEDRYGTNPSYYAKFNVMISDMLSVLKGILSIGN
jgi:hypothetical protein